MIEEPPSNISKVSPEEQSAVEQFKDSVSRNSEGRYIVALPRRDSAQPCFQTTGHAQVTTESDIPDEKGQMGRLSESSC